VALEIDAYEADATGYEPVYRGTVLKGYVTSGGYGHNVQKSLAMGYVDSDVQTADDELTVTLLGEPRSARIVLQALIDPTGARMRS
jgi:dimethylglycine dehydrogenase